MVNTEQLAAIIAKPVSHSVAPTTFAMIVSGTRTMRVTTDSSSSLEEIDETSVDCAHYRNSNGTAHNGDFRAGGKKQPTQASRPDVRNVPRNHLVSRDTIRSRGHWVYLGRSPCRLQLLVVPQRRGLRAGGSDVRVVSQRYSSGTRRRNVRTMPYNRRVGGVRRCGDSRRY